MTEAVRSYAPEEYEKSALYQSLPKRPNCADNYADGITIRRRDLAIRYPHIQPCDPWKRHHIILDCDYPIYNPETLAPIWEEKGLPQPSMAVITPETGTAHLWFTLDEPVYKNNPKQWPYYQDVEAALIKLYGADPAYAYVYTKNPYHPQWKVFTTGTRYTLGELKSWAPSSGAAKVFHIGHYTRRAKKLENAALGRNCQLFEDVRLEAYQIVNSFVDYDDFHLAVRELSDRYNSGGLDHTEIKATTKSIARWTWANRTRLVKNLRRLTGEKCPPEEIRPRQVQAALTTAAAKRSKTLAAIETALSTLPLPHLQTLTCDRLATLIGRSLSTARRYWQQAKDLIVHILEVATELPPKRSSSKSKKGAALVSAIRWGYQDLSPRAPAPAAQPPLSDSGLCCSDERERLKKMIRPYPPGAVAPPRRSRS